MDEGKGSTMMSVGSKRAARRVAENPHGNTISGRQRNKFTS
jgi:hypothetical protein